MPRCLIPGFDGALFSPRWREALWAKFFTAAPQRQRRSVERSVAKWRKRDTVTDLPIGPTHPKSTVLTIEEEAIVTGFRRHTPLAGRCRVRLGSAGPSDLPSMPRSPDDRGIFSRASSRRNEKPR